MCKCVLYIIYTRGGWRYKSEDGLRYYNEPILRFLPPPSFPDTEGLVVSEHDEYGLSSVLVSSEHVLSKQNRDKLEHLCYFLQADKLALTHLRFRSQS